MKIYGVGGRHAATHRRVMRLQIFYIEQDGLCAICGKPLKGFTPKIVAIRDWEKRAYINQHLVHLRCTDRQSDDIAESLAQKKAERMKRRGVVVGPQGGFVSADFEMIF